jgi:bifunctional ADP-heptose synthase (sugar kinase/adenylyltransferase)
MLGNIAASIVVKRFGAATTTPAELQMALDDLDEDLLMVTSVQCK